MFFLYTAGVMVFAKGYKGSHFLNDGFHAFSNKAANVLRSRISKDVAVILTT